MKFTELPLLGSPLNGGIFAGVITQKDGTHVAVVLLPERGTKMTWGQATDWAQKQCGVLPTRPIAALLFANARAYLSYGWHWTSEEDEGEASYAWYCRFNYGTQLYTRKSYEGAAVAVRLIVLE